MTNIERAYLVAERIHANQTYDIYPYIFHIQQTVWVARELGYDEAIIVGCALHDSMEDGNLSYNDIKKAFGEEVAEIVFAVTDELGRSREEKKAKTYPKIRNNWKATVVKICDRIANIRHSIDYNPEKFKTYRKEHENFVISLKSDDHPQDTKRAWVALENLIKNE